MVLRLLVPVGAVAGTVAAGLSGVFPSFLRTSATTTKYRKKDIKKVEVEKKDISVKVSCTETELDGSLKNNQEGKKASFEWAIKLDNGDESKLTKKEDVEKTATVSLKDDKGLTLWKKGKGGIFVERKGGAVGIQYADSNDEKVSKRFICQVNEKAGTSGDEIYKDGVIRVDNDGLGWQFKLPMTVAISLGECNPNDNEENPQECPLKVTDDSNLDWSEKVHNKAKVSWE